GPIAPAPGDQRRGRCLLETRFGAFKSGLIWAGVDGKERVSTMDLVTFPVGDSIDIASNAGTDVDRLDCADPTVEFIPIADFLEDARRDIDFCRRRWVIRRNRLVASRKKHRANEQADAGRELPHPFTQVFARKPDPETGEHPR